MKKKLLFALLPVIVIGATLILASHPVWFPKLLPRLVPWALNKVAASWNGTASIGKITLQKDELELSDIVLSSNKVQLPPVLTAQKIKLHLPFWSLLFKQSPEEIDIERAQIYLVRDSGGRWNFRPVKPQRPQIDGDDFQPSTVLTMLRRLMQVWDRYSRAIASGNFARVNCHNCSLTFVWENHAWEFKDINLNFEQRQMNLKLTTSAGEKLEFLGEILTIEGVRQIVLSTFAPSSLKLPVGRDQQIKLKWAAMKCTLILPQKKSLQTSCNWLQPSIVAEPLADGEVAFPQLSLSAQINFAGNPLQTLMSGTLGDITWQWQTDIFEQDHLPKIKTHFKVLSFNDQQWKNSLPDTLLGPLKNFKFKGNLGYQLNLEADFNDMDELKIEAQPVLSGFKLQSAGAEFGKLSGSFEQAVYDGLQVKRKVWVGPENPLFIPYNQIPHHLVNSVLTNEDGTFFKHHGFHSEAIRRSIIQNWREKKFKRGASTISMQFVKNVFLNRKKNLARKFQEAMLTWLLEYQKPVNKERMLEIYFNIIEFGPNVYGLGEAAAFYFNKQASELTFNEALFLTVLIPSPKKYYRRLEKDGTLRESTLSMMRFVAQKMKRLKVLPYTLDMSNPEWATISGELKFSDLIMLQLQGSNGAANGTSSADSTNQAAQNPQPVGVDEDEEDDDETEVNGRPDLSEEE